MYRKTGSFEEAAMMLRSVIDGNKSPAYDIAALNAAAALVVAGRVGDLHAGLERSFSADRALPEEEVRNPA